LIHTTAPTVVNTLSLHDALPIYLGPERAPGGSRGPVLRPCRRTRGQIPGVGPGVVPVARAHAQPHPSLLAPLEQDERLAVQRLRSEEHTSELQSLRHLVCRLLLE